MEVEEDQCNIGLGLGIGSHKGYFTSHDKKQPPVQFHILFPPRSKKEEEEEEEEEEITIRSKKMDREEEDVIKDKGCSTRKKLRLTKEQSTLLEDSFREHNTLNPTQKQELAERLNLRPRQLEVWFQNRRARSKLKQREVDCELLKKWCKSLRDENRRIRRELQELRSMKTQGSAVYVELPNTAAATLTVCPSCERIATAGGGSGGVGDSSLPC